VNLSLLFQVIHFGTALAQLKYIHTYEVHMKSNMFKIAGIFPFLAVAFLNAFTDLGHKIVVQNTLTKIYSGPDLVIYSALIQAMILLPFIFTFTPAGFIGDKFPKDKIMKWSAFAAIPITAAILYSYHFGHFQMAFGLTLLLAIQSAIYSPAKYGYIKELVGKVNLAPANSAIQGLTIIAILAGTLIYTIIFENLLSANSTTAAQILKDVEIAGVLLLASATIEFFIALKLPRLSKTNTELKFSVKKYVSGKYLRENLNDAWKNKVIKQSIIGLSIFWAINQVLVSSFPAYLKETLGIDDTQIINGILAAAAIGIAAGAVFAAKVSKNYIEIGLIPMGAAGMSICLLTLPFLNNIYALGGLFIVFGFFGGSFIVPLNSLIQFNSKDNEAGHILAANNFIQTIAMISFLAITIALSKIGVSNHNTFIGLGVITLIGSLWTIKTFPHSLIRYIIGAFISARYKLNVLGLDNIPSKGGALLLGNHISWIDWAVLQMASPRPIRFVMLRSIYEKWYLRWLLNQIGIIPIARGASKTALAEISKALKNGEVIALFPEGHISKNGTLSIFRSGFERAAADTDAIIIPFYLHGLWGTKFSYSQKKYSQSMHAVNSHKVTVAFGEGMNCNSDTTAVKHSVQKLSIKAWNSHIENMPTLPNAWLQSAKSLKSNISVIGHDGNTLSAYKLMSAVWSFRGVLKPKLKNQNIGLLLPASSGGIIANLASLCLGKTLVNLNYTSAPEVLQHCADFADIKQILTSKQFVTKLSNKGFDLSELQKKVEFIYLEDCKEQISKVTLLKNIALSIILPTFILKPLYIKNQMNSDTAAILFSSGSEGTPKGVELTHQNILGNCKQTSAVLNPNENDVMLCSLPLFHAFGLTITTFMPLVEGLPLVAFPDPTDAKGVGKMIAEHKVSILCGTSTFLRIYAASSRVHPLMFNSIRMVVAGAERLRPEVRDSFKQKFGLDIYEGYGCTETTPVAAVNIPDTLLEDFKTVQIGNKVGTVGLPLPGTQFKVVDPETMEDLQTGEDGLILIGGTQIMKGYHKDNEKTASALYSDQYGKWYNTGDKGHIDEDGFLTIVDRYSRFAKIGGEMISLGTVETKLSEGWTSESEFACTAIPSVKKGEELVLITEGTEEDAKMACKELPALMRPNIILVVESIPKLGTGKTDFKNLKALALELS
jgi:acyl-[acyl-carrier-protein]-phospholipid O-acyltransferase / long-chain-fatty-acid--[acyl-carrier-protein] ligase